jgi:hypothetical protein
MEPYLYFFIRLHDVEKDKYFFNLEDGALQ